MKTVKNIFFGFLAILVLGLTTLSFASNRETSAEDKEPLRAQSCRARNTGSEAYQTRVEGEVETDETDEGEGRGEQDTE